MEKEQMKLNGRVQTIFNTQVISDKFRKRELVLNTGGEYAQQILFQFTNDSCEALEGLNEGDQIDIYFDIRGREWTNPKTGEVRYFNTLNAWKYDVQTKETVQSKATTTPVPVDDLSPDNDLPF
jgi:hypothetical protein